MPKFEIHLLAGAIVAFFIQKHPAAAISFLLGSVFPDIDNRKSITHRTAVLFISIIALAVLYQKGLVIAVSGSIILALFFQLVLPRHRGWMHKFWGQILFGMICFLMTLDPLVAIAGVIGTSIHRILDWV